MNSKYLEYYKGIEQDYDMNKLTTRNIELFEMVNKYEFYGKRAKTIYLKFVYKLGYIIALYLAKKESRYALKNRKH